MKDKEKKSNDKYDASENNNQENQGTENAQQQEVINTKEEELRSKIEQLELELTAFKDKFLRKAAEFENYKRRTDNDQLNIIKYGAEGFIRRILPIIDDFERSLSHMDEAADLGSIKAGVELIYNKFIKILNEQGVKKIEALGKEFDVHYHEALLQRKADNVKPHTVIDELETGYIYNDKVIRHSKVAVSEDAAPGETFEPGDTNKNKEEDN